jgi:predicted peptidase
MQEKALRLEQTFQSTVRLDYLMYLPDDYTEAGTQRYPLILFLHGSGERGTDLASVKKIGLPARLANWPDCPFIAIAPQCPRDSIWVFELETLRALLDSVCGSLRVDGDRMYLTGLSLGATGVWYMATRYPRLFAAIAPISGRGISRSLIENLKETPVWAFHGKADAVVDPAESERMVSALRETGADARLTIYPAAGHDAWTSTYADSELYDWFLSHRLT